MAKQRCKTNINTLLILLCLASVYLNIQLNRPSDTAVRINYNKDGSITSSSTMEYHKHSTIDKSAIIFRENNPTVRSKMSNKTKEVKYEECKEVDHIVYIKIHKTASTTLATILERFGYTRNLTFSVPNRGHGFSPKDLFNRNMIHLLSPKAQFNNKSLNSYHLHTNHARYNRPEMDAVVHDAKYITMIREPTAHFESNFGYYEIAKSLRLTNHSNPIKSFMKTPKKFLEKKFYMWQTARNGQLFDLGLDHNKHDDIFTVKYKIRQLDSEFDLVLLTEYFDESLILLKKIMCWSFEDILYVSNGIRSSSHRYALTDKLRAQIHKWNGADVMMYNHFNETLWRKIKEYGTSFDSDLAKLKQMEQETMEKCIDEQRFNTKDRRLEKFVLKPNMTDSIFCKNILRGDVEYTNLNRRFMQNQNLYPMKTQRRIKSNVTQGKQNDTRKTRRRRVRKKYTVKKT